WRCLTGMHKMHGAERHNANVLKELISRQNKSQQETQLKESGQQRVVHKNLKTSVTNVCDRLLREQERRVNNTYLQHDYENDRDCGPAAH
ncbi:hypothetical protein L9F63_007594, partial [Diploptera punctata]